MNLGLQREQSPQGAEQAEGAETTSTQRSRARAEGAQSRSRSMNLARADGAALRAVAVCGDQKNKHLAIMWCLFF